MGSANDRSKRYVRPNSEIGYGIKVKLSHYLISRICRTPKTARCAALHHTNCFDLEILGAMIQVPLLRRLEVMRINGHHLHRGSRVGRHEDHRGYAAIDGK